MKIGFIGYGNMAQAIAQGLTRAHAVDRNDIVACAAHFDKLERNIAAVGGTAMHTPQEVVAAADMVVVAIKPYQIEDVLAPMAGALADDSKMIVSLAAGWDLARYQTLFGESATGIHIQCTIPNTPMAVAQGVLICENVNTLTPSQCQDSSTCSPAYRSSRRSIPRIWGSRCASPVVPRRSPTCT